MVLSEKETELAIPHFLQGLYWNDGSPFLPPSTLVIFINLYRQYLFPLSSILQFEAAKRHEFVEVTMWCYEFEGYDANLSLKQNIIHRYGN